MGTALIITKNKGQTKMKDNIKQLLRDCSNTQVDIEEISDDILNLTEVEDQFEKLQSRIHISGIKIA